MKNTKKINIVFSCNPNIIGGTENFLFRLLKNINTKIFNPIVLYYGKGVSKKKFNDMGIETISILTKDPTESANKSIEILKTKKISLAQSNSFSPILALACKQLQIPHIWRIGGHIDIACPTLNKKEKEDFLKLIILCSNKIVCNSKYLMEQFSKFKQTKCQLIYNGIDLMEMRQQLKKNLKIKCEENSSVISMIAHFIPQKRHYDFIKAAEILLKKNPQVNFKIYGNVYPHYEESLKYFRMISEMISKSKFRNNFQIIHNCPNILGALQLSDILVLPSIKEGFGNVLLEAMAMGKVVLGANSGGIPELIEAGKTGLLFKVKDPQELANALFRLLNNLKLSQKLSSNAKKMIEKKFNIKKMISSYHLLYEKIIK